MSFEASRLTYRDISSNDRDVMQSELLSERRACSLNQVHTGTIYITGINNTEERTSEHAHKEFGGQDKKLTL
jgi:hypothetical protein